jgi:hypothetical protein
VIRADALSAVAGVRHGFFTRQGGVSQGVYASRNCGFGSGDEAALVAENRARAMADIGLADGALVTAYQCHGTRCITVSEPWATGEAPEADAMVSDRPGVALGVLTADCAPVLLADRRNRVIGAAHAGWRGALAGVVEAAMAGMAALGARPADTVAAVGPCIGQASYEVGPEFHEAFAAADPANAGYFAPSVRNRHHMFDLAAYTAARLATLGLASVEVLGLDTCADGERFFSYRRACHEGEADYGRLISVVALGKD